MASPIFSIAISSEAETDIDEAFLWYEFQVIGLGERFVFFVDKGFDTISNMPASFTPVFDNMKKFVMEKFPYNIYYRIDAVKSQIEIIRILHHKKQQMITD